MTRVPPPYHADMHNTLGTDPIDTSWIYVGTLGATPDVDALLATNPYPYAPGDPVGPPPFENGWNNVLGSDAPVSFCITTWGWTYIRGTFTGGSDGTVVFTLPAEFSPAYRTPLAVGSLADGSGGFTAFVDTDGTVNYVTTI